MKFSTDFAEACYNQNSILELLDAYAEAEADQTDCETWDIAPQEWMDSIAEALGEKMRDWFLEVQGDSDTLDCLHVWANRPAGSIDIDDDGDVISPSGAAYTTDQLAGFFRNMGVL